MELLELHFKNKYNLMINAIRWVSTVTHLHKISKTKTHFKGNKNLYLIKERIFKTLPALESLKVRNGFAPDFSFDFSASFLNQSLKCFEDIKLRYVIYYEVTQCKANAPLYVVFIKFVHRTKSV